MDALRKMFSSNFGEREFHLKDFHHAKDEKSEDINRRYLSIETRFDFSTNPDAVPHFFLGMVVGAQGEYPYLRLRLEATWKKSAIEPDGELDSKLVIINVPEGADVKDENKVPFPSHLRSLIQILYVPAIRRPAEQLKYASGSLLYRVLRKIKWTDDFTLNFNQQVENINNDFKDLAEFKTVQNSINQFWQQFHKEDRYRQTSIGFGGSDFESILKKLEISFSPTEAHKNYKIDELGDGYRSLFYLTLVCSLLDIEEKFGKKEDNEDIGLNRPLITLLAIEEPENHIAPQLLGRVVSILTQIAKQPNSQVILSSHTPSIVKRVIPESIFHFRINDSYETEINQIVLPEDNAEAYKYVRQAIRNYPEIYFAKLVVIGEGDSEEIIFNRLMEVMNLNFDDNILTFTPLGHRFVNHIWKLLTNLHIPFVTLLDLDLEREGGAWGRVKYALKELIASGVRRNDLLNLKDGTILENDKLEKMHEWNINYRETLDGWLKKLEHFSVFYSSPLDLDFVMLTCYSKFYKDQIPKGGGPRIPDKLEKPDAFEEKVSAAVKATLKSEDAIGEQYTEAEKELMIWYNYHFLGRGKPATHIATLAVMTDEDIRDNLPEVFTSIFHRIENKLR